MFAALRRALPPRTSLWGFSLAQWAAAFARAAQRVNADVLRPTLYGNRHGGASYDRLVRRLPIADIKHRGRWRTDSSLRRYEKASLMLQQLNRAPQSALLYGDLVRRACLPIFQQVANDMARYFATLPAGAARTPPITLPGSYQALVPPLRAL